MTTPGEGGTASVGARTPRGRMTAWQTRLPRSQQRLASSRDQDLEPTDAAERAASPLLVDPAPWSWREDGRTLLLLFLAVWAVYLATATYDYAQINDNRATATSAWSLATRGTLALPAEWEGTIPWETPGRDGQLFTDRFPGGILLTFPAYVVADLLGRASRPSHPIFLNLVPAGITAATVAALVVAVMFGVFRRLADRRTAIAAAAVFAFGTANWSVNADAVWTHAPASLGLALSMLALSGERNVLAGAGYALSILSRPQLAVVPAIVGLWHGLVRRRLGPIAGIGVVSAMGLLLVSLYSRALFGTWLPIAGYEAAKVDAVFTTSLADLAERFSFMLIHPQRGVLIFTPVLLLLVPFYYRGWQAAPTWVRSSAVAGVGYLIVQLRSNDWHGGFDFFGSRLTLEPLVLAAPLFLCVWLLAIRPRPILRKVFGALAVASVSIHLVGATVWSITPEGRQLLAEHIEEICSEDHPPAECRPS